MPLTPTLLFGKRGLVVGIANGQSIAAGCARAFRASGADLAVTYFDERAKPFVIPVAEEVGAGIVLPLDVEQTGSMEAVFDRVKDDWGKLDFLLHSIAFCPKEDLHGRVADCSRDGFARAMDVSVHSFIRMARLAEPLMSTGGCLLTVSYYGAEKVVPHYNVMGVAKAALEASTRYLAYDLGPKKIRVNCISAGPVNTLAARGISGFSEMLRHYEAHAPLKRNVLPEELGATGVFLASDGAAAITGQVIYVDAGYQIMGM